MDNIYEIRKGGVTAPKVRGLKGDFLLVDRAFVRSWAKMLGPCCMAVYLLFCSMVDKEQKCFPAMDTIRQEVGFRKQSVVKAIRLLESYRLVVVKRQPKCSKKPNVYWLTDKSRWIYPTKENGFARPEEFVMYPT